jgi:hypothetical protein
MADTSDACIVPYDALWAELWPGETDRTALRSRSSTLCSELNQKLRAAGIGGGNVVESAHGKGLHISDEYRLRDELEILAPRRITTNRSEVVLSSFDVTDSRSVSLYVRPDDGSQLFWWQCDVPASIGQKELRFGNVGFVGHRDPDALTLLFRVFAVLWPGEAIGRSGPFERHATPLAFAQRMRAAGATLVVRSEIVIRSKERPGQSIILASPHPHQQVRREDRLSWLGDRGLFVQITNPEHTRSVCERRRVRNGTPFGELLEGHPAGPYLLFVATDPSLPDGTEVELLFELVG